MKITFSNLGAIKKTTLNLRPLTVIIGPNNSNKTYIAYSIYGLLKGVSKAVAGDYLEKLGYNSFGKEGIESVNVLSEVNDDVYSLKINKDFYKLFFEEYSDDVHGFEKRLDVFFQDSSKKAFRETKFQVSLKNDEIKEALLKLVNGVETQFNYSLQLSLEKNVLRAKFSRVVSEDESLSNRVALMLGFDLKHLLFSNPILLPAERNALIITYKILEAKRYDLLREIDRESIKQPPLFSDRNTTFSQRRNIRYPQPIEDFLTFLTDLELENQLEKGKFSEFAKFIEDNLQNNNKTNYVPTEIGGREIKINVKKGLDIDLYNASSSVKQLAPLLLYLRYRAQENDLLIIDEPEMNLHPESQAKLLEVLGMLVNAGVKVLLTTHSPYFMSHLNNLIAGNMSDEETREKQAQSLYLGDARAFLKPEDVSAYEMRQNKAGNQTLHDLHDKDYGIRWDTLSDVSADIQQKFFEIYEQKESSSNGEEK